MALLQLNSVLRKTDLGIAAIKERDRSVAPRSRTLLIMVDGVKSVQELTRFSSDAAHSTQLLNELVAQGMVVETNANSLTPTTSQPPSPTAPQAARALDSESPARDLKMSIRAASRMLESLIGPASVTLCLQLEKCKTQEEFVAMVIDFRRVVASAASQKKADEFVAIALGS